jgi:hypothetical protein
MDLNVYLFIYRRDRLSSYTNTVLITGNSFNTTREYGSYLLVDKFSSSSPTHIISRDDDRTLGAQYFDTKEHPRE